MAHPILDRRKRLAEKDRADISRRLKSITPEFVEYIPTDGDDLITGVVYITMKHGMVVYRCPCGCERLSEFMLDPIRYRMEYDGSSVSFYPSIGIPYLECRSHYWIRNNQIQWCAPMEDWEIEKAQKREFANALEVRDREKNKGIRQLWSRFASWWKR